MNTPLITITAIVLLAALYVLFPVVLHTFQRYRYKKAVECPETKGLAEVNIDVQLAAFSSAFGKPLLRVKSCSIWPRRWGCGQECLKERPSTAQLAGS